MRPWIHVAYIPLYVLLLTAATGCFIGLGEIRQRATAVFSVATSPARLIWDLFAVIASSMMFFLLLVGVGLFVGLGFGPFYLLLGVVTMIMFVLVPVMFIPPLSRRIEALTSRQIVVGSGIVVAAAFFASFLYVAVARSAGIAFRFAEAM